MDEANALTQTPVKGIENIDVSKSADKNAALASADVSKIVDEKAAGASVDTPDLDADNAGGCWCECHTKSNIARRGNDIPTSTQCNWLFL